MVHEKTFKRPDGSKVKIEVRFFSYTFTTDFKYTIQVYVCEPGKRYNYIRFKQNHQEQFKFNKYLNVVSADEIKEAKNELWEKLKP